MPDHIHFAIFATDSLPHSLGSYIGKMKVRCLQQIRERFPQITEVFTTDFYDRYLRPANSLSVIIDYIRQNPARRLTIEQNPDYFRKINNIEINGLLWQAYGNLQLLDNPFKGPVIVHRADSPELLITKRRRWKHLYENGGVLVSPFISPAEKEIRLMCEAAGGKIILLSDTPFGDRQKPGAHDFELCSTGRLLILAPVEAMPSNRETFLFLNATAKKIAMGCSERGASGAISG
ncbi:MAG: hypothetical protein K2M55_07330 [Muribaculaceae bacterium]|nr:hypothetical protein [Muribaculaceae bacterium]